MGVTIAQVEEYAALDVFRFHKEPIKKKSNNDDKAREMALNVIYKSLEDWEKKASWDELDARQKAVIHLQEVLEGNGTNINLKGYGLTTLPRALGCKLFREKITELDISGNNLKKVNKSLYRLVNLKKLHMGHNQLEMVSKSISKLHHLEVLELNNNKLSGLPSTVKSLKGLVTLLVDHNEELSELPVKKRRYLQTIRIEGTKITKTAVEKLFTDAKSTTAA